LVPVLQQVDHPAIFFAADNNGAIVQLPPLVGVAATLTGSLTFGINTQFNNGLGNATVFTVNSNDYFTTNLTTTGQSLTSSFIDSGSTGFFFPDGNIPTCSAPASMYFCPAALTSISATSIGMNSAEDTINFSVDNAESLFAQYPSDGALSMLGGQNGTGTCQAGSGACSFDWGMPFFYGRSVYAAINGQAFPISTPPEPPAPPPGPWWAFAVGEAGR
jgi:hypothetical protein